MDLIFEASHSYLETSRAEFSSTPSDGSIWRRVESESSSVLGSFPWQSYSVSTSGVTPHFNCHPELISWVHVISKLTGGKEKDKQNTNGKKHASQQSFPNEPEYALWWPGHHISHYDCKPGDPQFERQRWSKLKLFPLFFISLTELLTIATMCSLIIHLHTLNNVYSNR